MFSCHGKYQTRFCLRVIAEIPQLPDKSRKISNTSGCAEYVSSVSLFSPGFVVLPAPPSLLPTCLKGKTDSSSSAHSSILCPASHLHEWKDIIYSTGPPLRPPSLSPPSSQQRLRAGAPSPRHHPTVNE